ncbi:hypothetical protein N8Z09_00830 [Methylophilaceae bacterium]|nr:hypothetical protein [Methylophilaceae bacterium]
MKRKFLLGVSSALALLASQSISATIDQDNAKKISASDKIGSLVMDKASTSSLMMVAGHSSHSSHSSHGSHSSHSSGY